jgi:[ribosomal protein S18]-alanine N-acetyltransferase
MKTSQTACDGRVRWMIRGDLERVLEIEKQCYEFPWHEEDFLNALRSRACIGMVVEMPVRSNHYQIDRVFGFMIYELRQYSILLLNISVAEEARRCGLGSQMVEKLKYNLTDQRRRSLRTIVRDTNLESHLFFKSCGLRATQVLENHYGSGRDGYEFVYRRSECNGS